MKRQFVKEDLPPRPFRWLWNSAAGRLEPVAIERHVHVRRWHWGIAASVAAAALIYGSLVPFQFNGTTLRQAQEQFQRLWAEGLPAHSTQDVAVNVMASIPLSFALMGALLLHRRSTAALFVGAAASLAVCIGLSFAVEFAQFWVDARVSSLRDVAAQSAGAAIGGILWLAFGSALSRRIDEFLQTREPASRVVWLLNAYVIGLVAWSLFPFDVATNLGEIERKYHRGQMEIVPFTYEFSSGWKLAYSVVSQTVLFIPLGIWSMVAWVRHRSQMLNPWNALAICLGMGLSIEFAQLLMVSRYTSTRDVLMGMTGCTIGIVGTRCWQSRRRTAGARQSSALYAGGFWFVMSFVYLAVLLGIAWAPFDFTRDRALIRVRLERFVDVPYRSLLAGGSDLGAIIHTVRNFAWYFPLGALLAHAVFRSAGSPRLRASLMGLAAVAVIACAIVSVLGQLMLPGTTVDLTESLIRGLGGLSGLVVAAVTLSKWTPRSRTSRR